MAKVILKNDSGFSLLEILIAIAIFAIFSTTFVAGLSYNLFDSFEMKQDTKIRELLEHKFHEVVLDPPAFGDILTKETKTFEQYPDYSYTLEVTKFVIPNMNASEEGEESEKGDAMKELEKRIFTQIKDNMEKMIWQVSVTVVHKETTRSLSMSGWLYDNEAKVEFAGF